MTSILIDFVSMNPPIFLGSKVGEYPHEFLDGVYLVLNVMAVTSREKSKLPSYQLRGVSHIWYAQWKDNRPNESDSIEWEEFKEAFLGKYFPVKEGKLR